LVGLRGVVLGLAYLDPQAATMTWLGVGNVGGILLRQDPASRPSRVSLVPSAGFIGAEQTHPTTRSVPLALGDTIILYSDGIQDGFAESVVLAHSPQEIADFVITRHVKGTDDALVLVARYAR
jgi:serine phosphatase RsbU (regulator of sigma subunit)